MLLPPPPLIARRVVFAVVDSTKRHGEFVTCLESKTPWLGIAHVMRVRRPVAAAETGLLRNAEVVVIVTRIPPVTRSVP